MTSSTRFVAVPVASKARRGHFKPSSADVIEPPETDDTRLSCRRIPTSFSRNPNYRPRLVFDTYTAAKLPQSFTPVASTTTTLLWGYENQYPVAEVKNATFEQVRAALQLSAADLEVASATALPTADYLARIAALRTNLPEAIVTTYTYEPLVGMASSTDPAGVTTTYAYDGFQRLNLVRDQDNNIVKQYQYNYRK